MGFSGCFLVDCRGRSGGLALLWQESVGIKSYSNGHIDCLVHESEKEWRFTGFYGHPKVTMRHFSWEMLHRLKSIAELKDMPWIVGGNFNEICFDSENLCGIRRALRQMQDFRELCELQDLNGTEELFTWDNIRYYNHIIFERLDRFVGNMKWRMLFPAARLISLECYHSDRIPIS
ncbi:uncharacterized protein [Primulina eburnea]|uniref:uncharacterized protein n=1 Tax=Primulina eburnea TaxID=1245227 RepID=UPI003C6C8E02